MLANQKTAERRERLAQLVVGLGEERALKWLEEKLWIEPMDEYGGPDLPALVADELNVLSDEQVEECIAELEN